MTTSEREREWDGEPKRDAAGEVPADPDSSPTKPEAAGPREFELNGKFLGGYDGRDPTTGLRLQAIHPAESSSKGLKLIFDEGATLLPFHFLRTGDRLGRAVVKLLRSDGAAGTGFLVAPGILLTNNHVLPDPATANLAVALANFEAAPLGTMPGRTTSVPLDPEALFVTNADLDFTFCGVRGLDYLGAIGLDRNSRNIATSETVNIIQHPRGRPKEVAMRDNRVVKADGVVIHYECSTEPGSSGSPVFNNRWETVALHHASVRSEGPDAPPADAPSSRYLNEGIRISAIAIWLETVEANAPDIRDQVTRLRGIITGIDPRVGFFGALGRKSRGRAAAEVVGDRADADDIDLAFWNIRGLEWGSREQIIDVARVVAEMGMDLWCLAHADPDYVASLREHLTSYFGLDYELHYEPADGYPSLAFLHRRSKAMTLERTPWGIDLPEGVVLPPLITVRTSTRRTGPIALQLLVVGRSTSAEATPTPYAEAVRHAIRCEQGEFDWVVVGEAPVLFAPDQLRVLADCDRELLAVAAAKRDGAVALLAGPRSKVAQVFVSPNLLPAFGVPEAVSVARDRELPPIFRTLAGNQPVALRLALDADPRPPSTINLAAIPVERPQPTPPVDDLERRVRDMIAPILAKLLGEVRPPKGG
jgi:V8-like Glu-specific endopeptidase